MNVWLWAAVALLFSFFPAGWVCFRGPPEDRLVGLEMSSVLAILALILLSEGFHRPPFYDIAITLTLLSFGGGLVFTRFLQRWL